MASCQKILESTGLVAFEEAQLAAVFEVFVMALENLEGYEPAIGRDADVEAVFAIVLGADLLHLIHRLAGISTCSNVGQHLGIVGTIVVAE